MTTPDEHRRNAIKQAARAGYELHVRKAVASRNITFDPAPWDSISPDAQRPWLEEAELAIDTAYDDLRRAFAEEAAQAIEDQAADEFPRTSCCRDGITFAQRVVREIGGIA